MSVYYGFFILQKDGSKRKCPPWEENTVKCCYSQVGEPFGLGFASAGSPQSPSSACPSPSNIANVSYNP